MFSSSISYEAAINFAASLAPDLPVKEGRGSQFFKWAEDFVALLAHIYFEDHNQVMEDLVEAVKEEQGYEDLENDENDEND